MTNLIRNSPIFQDVIGKIIHATGQVRCEPAFLGLSDEIFGVLVLELLRTGRAAGTLAPRHAVASGC